MQHCMAGALRVRELSQPRHARGQAAAAASTALHMQEETPLTQGPQRRVLPSGVQRWRSALQRRAHSSCTKNLDSIANATKSADMKCAPQAACELHQEAVEALEREGRAGASGDVYRHAIGALLRLGRTGTRPPAPTFAMQR